MNTRKLYFTFLILSLGLSQLAFAEDDQAFELESEDDTIGEIITYPCGAQYIVGNPEDVETNENSARTKSNSSSVSNQ